MDLAKPKSGAPRLFILTAILTISITITIKENIKVSNCPRFDVSGCCFNNSIIFFALFYRKIHFLTSEFFLYILR